MHHYDIHWFISLYCSASFENQPMRTPPTLHINVNTNSPLKWDQWERRSCIVGWLWARERNKTFLAGLRLIWGYTDASSDEHIIGKIITVINMLSIQRKTYKWARKALLYHVVQRTAVFEPLRSVGPKMWELQQQVSEAHSRFISPRVPTEEHQDDGGKSNTI